MARLRIGSDVVDTEIVIRHVRSPYAIDLDPAVEAVLRAVHSQSERHAATGRAYGRTTGVGANRDVEAADEGFHGLRLVRSHATGAGPHLGDDVASATMLIRLHQLALPGSGIPFEVVEALARAVADGRRPTVRAFGGVGTGDITVLAEVALCLLGEMPWVDGAVAPYLERIESAAALALMSSSAPTLSVAAIAADELDRLVRASSVVAALGTPVVRANRQQWSEAVAATTRSPWVVDACASMRSLLAGSEWVHPRTQDPLSWRTWPFVVAPAGRAVHELRREVDDLIDAPSENPRYDEQGVWHHGAFHLAGLGLRLDTARLAVAQVLAASLARLVTLHDPAITGLRPFLAEGPAGASGTMVLEYTAASALDGVRHVASPTTGAAISISLGAEDHSSAASRGAQASRELVRAGRVVLACELVAAVRGVRQVVADGMRIGPGLRDLVDRCAALPADTGDRSLVADVEQAVDLLDLLTVP